MQRAELIELSVVLVATSNNPSIINPDFLLHNDIVREDLVLAGDAVSTPVYSQVSYQGGLAVRADPERVVFVHSASGPILSDADSPRMAARYVQAVPHVPYRAVGINPKLYVGLAETRVAKVADLLRRRGAWLTFEDSEPDVRIGAIYSFSSRRVTIEALSSAQSYSINKQTHGLGFQANVHHDLDQTSSKARIEAFDSIIHGWRTDVADCQEIAHRFIEQFIQCRT